MMRTAEDLIARLEESGLRFYIPTKGLIRSKRYKTPFNDECCPMSALYQYETGFPAGNFSVYIWRDHFKTTVKEANRVVAAADDAEIADPALRARLLKLVIEEPQA